MLAFLLRPMCGVRVEEGIGLSRPATLPSLLNLGCGSILVRRLVVASELAGRGDILRSLGGGGCSDVRRFDVPSGRNLDTACCAWVPDAARRSLNDILLAGFDGVKSGFGDGVDARSGLCIDILDAMGAAREDWHRPGLGDLLAYGLGVVRVRGLNLWPTSRLFVFVEMFHFGR